MHLDGLWVEAQTGVFFLYTYTRGSRLGAYLKGVGGIGIETGRRTNHRWLEIDSIIPNIMCIHTIRA